MQIARCIACLALALSAGCSGGDGSGAGEVTDRADESEPVLGPAGPVGAVVLTGKPTGKAGPKVEPRITFTTDDTALYALVPVADDAPPQSTLAIVWYRLEGDGSRTLLFRHELPIEDGGGRAVSEGIAEGGLAPGMYETVATLGEHEVRTPWFVRIAAPAGRSNATGTQAQASASSSATEDVDWGAETYDEDWSAPEGGEVDWDVPDDLLDVPSEPPGPCTVVELRPFAFIATLVAELEWEGTCSEVSLAAAVTGSPQVYASISDPPDPRGTLKMDEWYCDLPGGSDFPGTVVRVVGTASDGASVTVPFTLPDRSEEFGVEYESVPAVGARVEPGDTIQIRAFAMMLPPSLGVRVLYLDDGSELIDSTPNRSGATEPVPCDKYRLWALLENSRYRVPDDPPPIIEICAHAEGFNDAKVSYCGNFYTGEVWRGTWDGGWHVPPPCSPSVWRTVGPISLVVGADGSVSGRLDLTNHIGVCGGTDVPQEVPAAANITGRRTENGFVLEHVPVGQEGVLTARLTREGDTATGRVRLSSGFASYKADVELRCVTCG